MPRSPTRFVPKMPRAQRRRIERAGAKSRDSLHRDKCRAVLWSEAGKSAGEIAALLGTHRTTVHRWILDFGRFGEKSLETKPRLGRVPIIDADAAAALEQALSRNPRDLGYVFTRWTTETLTEHLYRAVHVRVHPETMRRALKRLGWRFNRPKLSLKHRQDPKDVARARRERNAFLKKPAKTPAASPFSSWTSASSTSTPGSRASGAR
jgi:putative transposase